MNLDPRVVELLAAAERAGIPRVEMQSPSEARDNFTRARLASALSAPEVRATTELVIPTENGAVPARLYHPDSVISTAMPAVVFFHGGGWVTGGIDSYDDICAVMAHLSGCFVMSVGYRLAPEHKFPTALTDAAASLRWLVDNSAEYNIDRDRVAVAGDSAGANLAAVLTILSRDGDLPSIRSQILIYPVTDLSMSMLSHDENMPGIRFTSESMRWYRDHYVRDKADRTDWRASPLFATSLSGTAPAFILTAGADPLRDDGCAYAEKLRTSGVDVRHAHYADQVHGFINFGRLLPKANAALEELAAELRRVMAF